nr:MAG TPA: hypothetical protein [Caudoviricetes sp.]
MSQIADIVKGHIREAFNINEDLRSARIQICKKCPLYSPDFGGYCNSKLWLNPRTNQISDIEMLGWIRGCGCRLEAKTRNPNNHCNAGKW